MTRVSICLASLLTLSLASAMTAQEQRKSPHETASVSLGGKQVTIAYGRPYLKGRKAVGGTLVPFGQVWRTGADEATLLTAPVDLTIGGLKVPAGKYALFTLPTESGWTLIVSKNFDQWGAFTYDQAQDLGRVPMQMSKPASTVEQFTTAFQKPGGNAATLTLSWENTTASVSVATP